MAGNTQNKERKMKNITNKWPHVVLKGEEVYSVSQVKDFILRTDPYFVNSGCFYSGNNDELRKFVDDITKIPDFSSFDNAPFEERKKHYESMENLKERIGFVELNYFKSDMADSCYTGGANGVLNIKGMVDFNKNIGKYPSNEEVAEELEKIAKAFPWLSFIGSIFDGERYEEVAPFLFSFEVNNGKATFSEDILVERNYSERDLDNSVKESMQGLRYSKDPDLPINWYSELAEKVRDIWLEFKLN